MSEDLEQKTEAPSEKRLRQAWEQGQVPLGHDLPLVASMVGGCVAMVSLGGAMRSGLIRTVRETAEALGGTPFRIFPQLVAGPAATAALICAGAALASAAATLVQTRGSFWFDRWTPDMERLFNPQRLTQLFSKKTLTDLGVAVVKVLALSWAAWSSIHGDFLTLPGLLGATPGDQLGAAFAMLLRAGWRLLLAASVIAGLDLAVVRHRYMRQMRVTRQEARRDMKEDEGDPLLKGKRKQRHRELSRGRARVEVPRADALLVNPTHIAIALRYRKDEARAPRVIAKGKGALAEYMRDLARENAIPIVENIPLARLLYRKVKVGREIPASTYKAVAAVLAFVYRLTGKGGRAAA